MNCADIKVALSVLNEQEKEFEKLIEELSDKEDKEGELSWIDKDRRDTTWKIIECYRKVAADLSMTYKLVENHEQEDKAICELSYSELEYLALEYQSVIWEFRYDESQKRYYKDKLEAIKMRMDELRKEKYLKHEFEF